MTKLTKIFALLATTAMPARWTTTREDWDGCEGSDVRDFTSSDHDTDKYNIVASHLWPQGPKCSE